MKNRTCETCNNKDICKYSDAVLKNIGAAKKAIQGCEQEHEPGLITIVFECKYHIEKMVIDNV